MHENCRIPAYSQSREIFDVMWWMCTVVSLFLSFFLQGKHGRLMTVMDSKFLWTWHEKCLWSALWVPDLMCPSTSVIYLELCSHREGIGLCCNWNILSCTCLDLDICLADKLVNLRFFFCWAWWPEQSLLVDYPSVGIAADVFNSVCRKQFCPLILPNAKILC